MSTYTGTSNGIYSVKWLNSSYTGPIFNFRRSSDNATSDFYVSGDGNSIGTSLEGAGTTLASWLGASTAYITKWYDQSTVGNHATQTNTSFQPTFDTSNKCVNFVSSTRQYFNLPNGTVPFNNTTYTVVVKHGTHSSSSSFVGSGNSVGSQQNAFAMSGTNYINYWWGNDFLSGTYSANNTVSWKYDGSSRSIYINGSLNSSSNSSSRASVNLNNYIGLGDTLNNNYANGQIYNILIYASALSDTNRLSAESNIGVTSASTYVVGGAICQYYFNNLSSTNVNNYKTGIYDLSLVNVGTASFPTITTVSKGNLLTPSLFQNTSSFTNYSYYVNNTNAQVRSLTGSFSVSWWTYIDSTLGALFGTVWCLYNDASNNFITFTQQSSGTSAPLILCITLNGVRSYIGSVGYAVNTYHRLALTCSTSGSTSTIKFYLNGAIYNFNTSNSGALGGSVVYNGTDTITVTGALFNGANTTLYVLGGPSARGITWPANSTSQSHGFNGYIGQLTIYNTVLSQSDISYLNTNQSIPPPSVVVVVPASYPCFLEGSKILRFSPDTYQDEYVPVESLRKGDLIATAESGYQPIHSIGYKTIPLPKSDPNPSNRLYKFSKKTCPTIFEPLYITGEHCTLHRNIPKEKRDLITEHMGDVYITEEYYRMPAFLDDRGESYDGEDIPATIWHFALEHENVAHNYGVFANGLLVESCAIESLMEKSGMRLLE